MAYTTLARVKQLLKIPTATTTDDDLITELIADAKAIIDEATDRTFEAPTDTTLKFDAVMYEQYLNLFRSYYNNYYDYYDWRMLWFNRYDCCQITQIINGDGTVVNQNYYVTLPINAVAINQPMYGVRLKLDAPIVWTWDNTPDACIQVTGRWAYSITAPRQIQYAATYLTSLLYKQKDNMIASNVGSPFTRKDGQVFSQSYPAFLTKLLENYVRVVL
jgi:hypothetical protein